MLPKQRRIRRSEDFTAVVRTGGRAATACLVVHVACTGSGPARAGVIVGRGVGGSVVRNRVARRLRHCLRGVLPSLPDGTQIVLRALPPAAAASSQTLCSDISTGVGRGLRRMGQDARTPPSVSQ